MLETLDKLLVVVIVAAVLVALADVPKAGWENNDPETILVDGAVVVAPKGF